LGWAIAKFMTITLLIFSHLTKATLMLILNDYLAQDAMKMIGLINRDAYKLATNIFSPSSKEIDACQPGNFS
jgi:hypothetical protein